MQDELAIKYPVFPLRAGSEQGGQGMGISSGSEGCAWLRVCVQSGKLGQVFCPAW